MHLIASNLFEGFGPLALDPGLSSAKDKNPLRMKPNKGAFFLV